MAITKAKKNSDMRYMKEKTSELKIRVTNADKNVIDKYLESQNIGFSTLCRRAIVADMLQHEWREVISLGRAGTEGTEQKEGTEG